MRVTAFQEARAVQACSTHSGNHSRWIVLASVRLVRPRARLRQVDALFAEGIVASWDDADLLVPTQQPAGRDSSHVVCTYVGPLSSTVC